MKHSCKYRRRWQDKATHAALDRGFETALAKPSFSDGQKEPFSGPANSDLPRRAGAVNG